MIIEYIELCRHQHPNYKLFDIINYHNLMADRTILLRPIPQDYSTDTVLQQFKQFSVKRVLNQARTTGRVYIQFSQPKDVQSVGTKYQDCIISALNNAEIELVEANFNWQQLAKESEPQTSFEVNQKCLVWLKNCQNVREVEESYIRDVFKKLAIGKIVKFEDKNQIILQLSSEDDRQLLDLTFVDSRVQGLGENAIIENDQEFDKELFIKQYYATRPQVESISAQKVEKNQLEGEHEVKKQLSRQQYLDYQKTIQEQQERQRLRKQEEAIKIEQNLRKQQEQRARQEQLKAKEQQQRKQAEQNAKRLIEQKFKKQAEQHARRIEAAKREAEAKQAELMKAKLGGQERARKFYQEKLRKAQEQARIQAENKIKQQAVKKQLEAQKIAADLQKKAQEEQQLRRKRQEQEQLRRRQEEERLKRQQQEQLRRRQQEELVRLSQAALEKETSETFNVDQTLQKVLQPELEKLYEQQRTLSAQNKLYKTQSPKKQINLPLLDKLNPFAQKPQLKQTVQEYIKPEIQYPQIESFPKRSNSFAYSSSLPTHFITLVLLGWVYYVLIH